MKKLLKRVRSVVITVPLLIGASGLTGAAIGITWTKSEVIPVVIVKPGIGGFEPVDGNSIGNTWRKSDVKPVLLVKPGIVGFEPREGISIGNLWTKDEILPVMLVEPSAGSFVPLQVLSSGHESTGGGSLTLEEQTKLRREEQQAAPTSPQLIEGQIEGDFEGWDGDTIVKLTNGQIWQQSEYHYHYHYAFMPKVLVFKSGSGYKMRVEGVEKAVGVKRLK